MKETKKETINVAAALMFKNEKLLICKRPQGRRQAGYWEFPGGKIECGEDPRDALKREIMEELGVRISVGNPFEVLSHRYDFGNVILIFFESEIIEGELTAYHHEEILWVRTSDLANYEFLPADKVLIKKLASMFP